MLSIVRLQFVWDVVVTCDVCVGFVLCWIALVRVADLSSCLPSVLLVPIICWCHLSNCLPLTTGPFQLLDPPYGRACWTMSSLLHLCQPSISIWKHFCSWLPSLTLSRWPVAYSPILSGFWSDLFTWTTLKIHNWLLDWLIDWLYHVISMSGSSGRRCNWKSQGSRQWLPWRWYVCL